MKKLIVGLFAALLTMAGLAAVPSPQASAACPYTGCVDTTTVLNGPTQGFRGDRLRFAVGVTAGDSIGTPRGSVRFKFVKADGPKRKKVTFEWNPEDVLKVIASNFEEGTPYKWIDFPQPNYNSASADMVMQGDKMVGMSMFNGYSFNERCVLSLGIVDQSVEVGDVLTLRWGEPDEIGDVVLFLLSDQARFVTGAILPVDGGYSSV